MERPTLGPLPGHCLQKAQNSWASCRQGMASGSWQWLRLMAPVPHSVLFCSNAEFRFSDKVVNFSSENALKLQELLLSENLILLPPAVLTWETPDEALFRTWQERSPKVFPSAMLQYLGLFFMPMFLCFLPKSSDLLKMHYKKALSIRKGPYKCVF